jgi:hypothetical protein
VCSLVLLAVVLAPSCIAQSTAPTSDLQAVAYAAQSMAAMTGGAGVRDVTLSANITRSAGSDSETGSATLVAKGFGESRIDLSLSSGVQSEVRNGNSGSWVGPDGAVHPIALHNCLTDTSWFFPALGSLGAAATKPNLVLTYVGSEMFQQASLQHLQAYTYDTSLTDVQSLSAMDFYLDSQSLLPAFVAFNEHPDNDETINISVRIELSDYRSVGGAMIPFHIQRYVNHVLALDVQLTSATVSSGIPDSDFNLQ